MFEGRSAHIKSEAVNTLMEDLAYTAKKEEWHKRFNLDVYIFKSGGLWKARVSWQEWVEETKVCTRCGKEKSITQFQLARKDEEVRLSACKQCISERRYEKLAKEAHELRN